jgi:hypothetical protein
MIASDRGGLAWTLLAVAVVISWFALEQQKPPAAKSADAPSSEFSSGRAMAIVRAIARAPHQTGTPENERVRGIVFKTLTDLGLSAEIQMPKDKTSPLRNVLGRLKGRGPSGKKALLLCAHYDTPQFSPGAGDDASGVAVVLETLRAIKAGRSLDRDVIAVLTDGEERGLQGSKLFVAEHPWAREVGVALNFDARGTSGPSFMFETSAGNGWLIRQFARASPRPLAISVSMDVYPILGNDSDLTSFKRAGVAGLNFSFIGGFANYHTYNDTVENLDPDSVQHDGDNALAMTRQFGGLDLDNPSSEDVIYASILGRMVVFYPKSWSMPIALGVGVAFLVVLVAGLWSRRVKISDLGIGALTWLIATLASVFAAHLFWMVLRDMMLNLFLAWGAIEVQILSVCLIIATVSTLALFRRVARGRSLEGLALGALVWWLVLAVITARWLPNSSCVFAWPTLFALIGLDGAILTRPGSASGRVLILIAAIPNLALLPPVIRNLIDGVGLRMAGPVMITVPLFLVAILPLLAPILVNPGRDAAAESSNEGSSRVLAHAEP